MESLVCQRNARAGICHRNSIIAVNELPGIDYLLKAARQLQIPVGCADCKSDAGYDVCVYSDDCRGVEESVRRLYELGWRDFTFLSEQQAERHYVIPRRTGFLNVMKELQLPVGREFSRWQIEEMLQFAPSPRAVICSSDGVALHFLIEAQRRGFRIPEEYAVIGFGNLSFGRECCVPTLSTVSQNYEQIGLCVAEKLISRLETGSVPAESCRIPTSVILRESTGRMPASGKECAGNFDAGSAGGDPSFECGIAPVVIRGDQ